MNKPPRATPPDRLAPHDLPSEMGVLGCLLLAPDASWDIVDTLRVLPEYWYDIRHRVIFGTMLLMREKSEPLDLINLQANLKSIGKLSEIGGLAYLSELQDSVPSAVNCSAYLDTMRDKYLLRLSLQVCTNHVGQVASSEDNVDDQLCELEKKILNIRVHADNKSNVRDTAQIIDEIDQDMAAALNGTVRQGIRTGLSDLDEKIGSLDGLVLIAGAMSSSKTSLALKFALNALFEERTGVGIISLETSAKKLMHRMITTRAEVNGQLISRGRATPEDLNTYCRAMGDLKTQGQQLQIFDKRGVASQQVCSEMRRMYRNGARLFIVDYLQKFREPGKDSRAEKIASACNNMQAISGELGCPMVMISSITKEGGKENKMPSIWDIKESGDIGYDADIVLLLHCKEPDRKVRLIDCRVAKAKDSGEANLKFDFYKEQYRFADHVRDSKED